MNDRRPLPDAAAARREIEGAGFLFQATPMECQGASEQGGYNAYKNGYQSTDALWLADTRNKDDALNEWLAGYWRALGEETGF